MSDSFKKSTTNKSLKQRVTELAKTLKVKKAVHTEEAWNEMLDQQLQRSYVEEGGDSEISDDPEYESAENQDEEDLEEEPEEVRMAEFDKYMVENIAARASTCLKRFFVSTGLALALTALFIVIITNKGMSEAAKS